MMRSLLAAGIAAILLGLSTAQNVGRLLEKYKDADQARHAWFQRMNPNGAPDFSKLNKVRMASEIGSAASTPYSAAGFVASSFFMDGLCSEPAFTTGFPVNTCYIQRGFAYMVRLTKDSCTGGVVEYYYDKSCSDFAGSSDLNQGITPCVNLGGISLGTECTTSSEPKIYSESVIIQQYRGAGCRASDSYFAIPSNQCLEADDGSADTMYTCDGGLAVVSFTAGSHCKTRTDTTPIPAMCFDTESSDSNAATSSATTSAASEAASAVDLASTAAALKANAKVQVQKQVAPSLRTSAVTKAATSASSSSTTASTSSDKQQLLDLIPTDDDVNYYDDDGGERPEYTYDDFRYSSGFAYAEYPHMTSFYEDMPGFLNPPPSMSGTSFPTSTAEANAPYTMNMKCQAAPQRTTVVFTAKQTIQNVGYSDYSSNKAAYEKTFKQAIASSIAGATEESVTNLAVTDASAAAITARVTAGSTAAITRAAPAPRQYVKRVLSGPGGLTLSYTVTVADSTLSAEALMGQLVTAVESGTFTEAMQAYAADNGADGLVTATSESVTTEEQDDEKKKVALSQGAIIGIAVGVGVPVLVMLLFVIVYCCSMACRRSSNSATAPAFQQVPAHVSPQQGQMEVPVVTATAVLGQEP